MRLDHDSHPIRGSGDESALICASARPLMADPAPEGPDCEGVDAQDTALMIAVGQGSANAFGVLVERHTPQLYRLAARMLGDSFEAEDVVQECFTRLWQNAPRWQPTGAGLVGWLHRVAMNLCLDRKRRFRVIVTPDVPDRADPAPLADVLIEAEQTRCAVADALAALPARHRAALVLCYYEGLSNASAAEVLDLNIKALESLLFRARRLMRERLQTRAQAWGEIAPQHVSAMT
ncbi:RNA polymerase sigma factor [Novosphingobium sp. Chol11]|uniref:RNA polymerase sigma factor n=1 Tax=Novosphingobium sp. Chol11 TaxID=1385763 RepID=UPI0025F37EC2|nr:RNA polymerase sigma factor [Novosphingobium sp. Chol11]